MALDTKRIKNGMTQRYNKNNTMCRIHRKNECDSNAQPASPGMPALLYYNLKQSFTSVPLAHPRNVELCILSFLTDRLFS